MSGQQIVRPSVSITQTSAPVAAKNDAQKVLIVGQQLPAGSALTGVLQTNIGDEGEEDALFGAASMVAGMVRAFKKINKIVQL